MKCYFKYAILILICFPVICCSQNEEADSKYMEIITNDSLVNGYYLSLIEFHPFSPVIEPEFNLPDTSKVNIFLTDTLYIDTLWVIREKVLYPGLYKVQHSVFAEYTNKTKNRTVLFHLEATNQLGDFAMNGRVLRFEAEHLFLLP